MICQGSPPDFLAVLGCIKLCIMQSSAVDFDAIPVFDDDLQSSTEGVVVIVEVNHPSLETRTNNLLEGGENGAVECGLQRHR